MSSKIKNGFKVINETLVSLSEEFLTSAKNARRATEEVVKEANNSDIKASEEFCLKFAMRQPDGNPLRGEDAVLAKTIMIKALDEEGDELYNSLKEAGFIHK